MEQDRLWDILESLQRDYEWVDLSNLVSEDTPHWDGFEDLKQRFVYDFAKDGFQATEYTLVGQYGTHVDAPLHFNEGADSLDIFEPKDFAKPLCVIKKIEECAENNDYEVSVQDILDYEEEFGRIPENAFVAFCSGWSDRKTSQEMDNRDQDGAKHYPGWSLDALKFLVEERNIGAVGHETSDTDSAVMAVKTGFAAETYILKTGRYQIELLKNLKDLPERGAIIFSTFLKMKDASGFPARCFAIVPKN